MIFKIKRLVVRELMLSDLDAFYEMQSNPNVMLYIKPALTFEETVSELNSYISYYSDPDKFYNLWAVENLENHTFIGMCGVYRNQQSYYELAYRLTESAWGHGYGSEIAQELIRYSLEELQLPSVIAYASKDNIGSVKILEKYMNFVEEAMHEKSGIVGRKYVVSKNR